MEVDLLFLSRDLSSPRADVWAAVSAQRGVTLRVHRIVGPARPTDASRYETIARARNEGKLRGSAPLVMLLDDDVVLDPDCVARLVAGLEARPIFAALAADSDGSMASALENWDYPRHVGMAAILFRRDRLESLRFRWETDKCECLCCCEDLRRDGLAIGYQRGAEARHLPESKSSASREAPKPGAVATRPGRILAAFDRGHYRLFIHRFLKTLRRTGNRETVTAVVSGLYASERRAMAAIPGVEVVVAPGDGHPARQRLRDFADVIADWPDETPVAYWDAGDILFQARLGPLWELTRAHPGRMLAARECLTGADNTVARYWIESIRDRDARARALAFLMTRPILNSGFAAGSALALRRYFRGADALLRSPAIDGSTDWGDQTAMNLFCHGNPDAWLEISSTWNYCLVGRTDRDFRVTTEGLVESLGDDPVCVAHGAGGALRRWDLLHMTT